MIFHFLKKKRYFSLGLLITFLMLFSQIALISTYDQPSQIYDSKVPNLSALFSDTKQWLNNTGFNTTEDWDLEKNTDEIYPDLNGTIENGLAKLEVLGNFSTKKVDNDLNDGTWIRFRDGIFLLPDSSGIDSRGCWVSHTWSEFEGGGQTHNYPSVHWKKNVSMGIDMSEYNITSASLEVNFSATVLNNVDTQYDSSYGSGGDGGWQYSIGDHIEFYVEISDTYGTNPSMVAYNKTYNLGRNANPQIISIQEKPIESIGTEADLRAALKRGLEGSPGKSNFNITLGITIYCEDNDPNRDIDTYSELLIKSCNLTFTYEKLINEFTSVSWNQNGNNVSSLSPYPVIATRANLKFQYKIDKDWNVYTPKKNSELNIYLNGNPYPIPIKLIDFNDSVYEWADIDLTPPNTNAGVNLSIEVLIRDDFSLDQIITIAIDNVTLDISYTIFAPDVAGDGGGGGGGTKYIRGEDYTWLVILLTIGIIALVSSFVAYQKHYKYPLIVRKIRALKKKIRKGSKTKPLLLNTREELIKKNFKNQTNLIMETELKPESIDKLKEGGK